MDRINLEFNSQQHIQALRQQGLQSQALSRQAGRQDAGQEAAAKNSRQAKKEQSTVGRVFSSLRAVFAK